MGRVGDGGGLRLEREKERGKETGRRAGSSAPSCTCACAYRPAGLAATRTQPNLVTLPPSSAKIEFIPSSVNKNESYLKCATHVPVNTAMNAYRTLCYAVSTPATNKADYVSDNDGLGVVTDRIFHLFFALVGVSGTTSHCLNSSFL